VKDATSFRCGHLRAVSPLTRKT